MSRKLLIWISTAAILILICFMVKDSLNQPEIKDMKAGFTEVAKYRNANNTGPVQRVYIVTVKEPIWTEMQDYGNIMPHTKYGSTKIYFFKAGDEVPGKLFPGKENFDAVYNKACIALYEKSAMSQVVFNKYPFK